MIGTITCLMFKNLHKKAFNYEHYNVVCCQSPSISLHSRKQIETEFLNSRRNSGIQIHSTLARALAVDCKIFKQWKISINIIKIHFTSFLQCSRSAHIFMIYLKMWINQIWLPAAIKAFWQKKSKDEEKFWDGNGD